MTKISKNIKPKKVFDKIIIRMISTESCIQRLKQKLNSYASLHTFRIDM